MVKCELVLIGSLLSLITHSTVFSQTLGNLESVASRKLAISNYEAMMVESLGRRSSVTEGGFFYKVDRFIEEEEQPIQEQVGFYVFDEEENERLHAFKTRGLPEDMRVSTDVVDEKGRATIARAGIYSPSEAFLLSSTTSLPQLLTVERPSDSSALEPFDFRVLGLAIYGDLLKRSPYEKIFGNYLARAEKTLSLVEDRTSPQRGSQKTFNYGGIVLTIDPERDYWVTSHIFKDPADVYRRVRKARVLSQASVAVEMIKGRVLPVQSSYSHPGGRLVFRLQWDPKLGIPIEKMEHNVESLKELLRQVELVEIAFPMNGEMKR